MSPSKKKKDVVCVSLKKREDVVCLNLMTNQVFSYKFTLKRYFPSNDDKVRLDSCQLLALENCVACWLVSLVSKKKKLRGRGHFVF